MTFIQKFRLKRINYGGNDVSPSPNSGYSVRLHSPKPFATLRASHTRETLCEIVGRLGGA